MISMRMRGADIVGLIENAVVADDRKLAAWQGAAISASMSTFQETLSSCTKGSEPNGGMGFPVTA